MSHLGSDPVYAGDLLGYAKASIRNTAAALTETATPQVRKMLTQHLRHAIHLHAKVFHYMSARGLYPAYHPERVIQNDFRSAKMALAAPVTKSPWQTKHMYSHMPHPPHVGAALKPMTRKAYDVYYHAHPQSHYEWKSELPQIDTESSSDAYYPYRLESDDERDDESGTHDERGEAGNQPEPMESEA
jgi:hypothetical protein